MFEKDFYGKNVVGIKRFLNNINIEDFKKYLYETYKEEDTNYSNIVYNKCRVSIGFLSVKLMESLNIFRDTYVYYGYVKNRWHCWFGYNGYFIDLTYAQFDEKAPEVTIVKIEDAKKNNLYSISGFMPLFRWIQQEVEESETDKNILDYLMS